MICPPFSLFFFFLIAQVYNQCCFLISNWMKLTDSWRFFWWNWLGGRQTCTGFIANKSGLNKISEEAKINFLQNIFINDRIYRNIFQNFNKIVVNNLQSKPFLKSVTHIRAKCVTDSSTNWHQLISSLRKTASLVKPETVLSTSKIS